MNKQLINKINSLPNKPGVYFFQNKSKEIIYIGKALSLKDRVKSYFQEGTTGIKTGFLLSEIYDIDIIETDSEKEAFLLENNLIRKYQPKYNIRLKDDKSYPYLKITIKEDFPKILFTRRVEQDGNKYFGPFAPAFQAKNTIRLICKYFRIRKCKEAIPGKRKRPCLDYEMELCSAPCVGLINKSEYREAVENAILFLEGKTEQLTKILTRKMFSLASQEKFEQAAYYRDLVKTIQSIKEKPKTTTIEKEDLDIFGFYREGNRVSIRLFIMRKGKIIDREQFYWAELIESSDPELLNSFLAQYYLKRIDIPSKIVLPFHPSNEFLLISFLKEKQIDIEFIVPKTGKYKKLIDLANRNAQLYLEMKEEEIPGLRELKDLLNLEKIPYRIEAFDISHIGGVQTVGSLIVFEKGEPSKKEYRKYKIKTVGGIDDVACIYEIVKRRYSRILEENEQLPNLVLIDGGKAQLNSAIKALEELEIKDLPIISIAKSEELIFIPKRKEPIVLEKNSPSLKLIQRMRDEAHRFAISFHRKLRTRISFKSILDEISGIGEKRKLLLLNKYGSLDEIKKASEEELAKLVGIKVAKEILKRLKSEY
ncbi:excinuclease ABC subunit UvrC [Candidatus Aminicenantes bacterium AH-873-B07]|nr:excinuclease ABC subunit UvrC [Candidatus Aminicenantes bacterium AH-873-B07]